MKAEDKLSRSEQRYRDLLEQAADGIFLLDENGNFLLTNSEMCEMLGYSREELLQLNILDTYPREHRDAGKARLDEIKSGHRMRFERTIERKDGSVRTVEMSARRLADGTLQGIAHDITERTRIESELALERSLLTALLENIPYPIYFKDIESRFIRTSRAHAQVFGLHEAREAIGKIDMDFFSEEHARKAYEDEQRIIRTGESMLNVEEKETWPDRPDTWALTTKMPLRDQEGNIIGTFGISRDITEQRQAARALKESEERYRVLFASLNDMILVHPFHEDLTPGTFVEVNEAACRILGYSREELRRMSTHDIDAPEGLPMGPDAIARLRAEGQAVWEGMYRRKDGRKIPVEISNRLFELDGKPMILATIRDISERKRLEAERETAMQRLEFVVGATKTGFDIIDADYNMQYIDPARLKAFGDYRGRKCYEYFRGRSSPCGDCAMLRALATHRVEVVESTNPAVATRPTQVTAIPYQTESGEWMVAEVSVDISERKQAEAERLELERRMLSAQKLEGLGILAGGIAHNFNNLLAVILGYAQLLSDATPGEVDFKTAIEEIKKAGFRSRDMIAQLLAMGRGQVINPVPLDLNQVLEDSRTLLRQAIRENIKIEFRLASIPCPVMADAGHIEQILLNLALNAQDAIPRDGSLVFETSMAVLSGTPARRHGDMAPGRYVCLTVSDTGAGMDRGTMDRIFEPFFTTKKEGKGTGLGLSTVYGIVKQHSGSIEVESEPGHGTRFKIYLPLTDTPIRPTREADSSQDRKGTETLLLVEDQDPVRLLLGSQLRNLGYTVLEAVSGEAALRIAAEHKGELHLLLTDVILDGMNGRELSDRLADERGKVKVIFMSGYAKGVLEAHGVTGEGVDFLQKPFDKHTLAAKVREVLNRS